ncbi:recombinase family protein [Mycobacterium aquaticum]|uniref:IS607 family transposase n=1 Tax=Mycobacterium aquaticum TaxID=1927124 RepID=A0A1X0AW75_9MYCO|nr:recombinase family protein [Mycobacterium aquaticum]ORA33926.1 IS607 family transposase [Mycobacterium aquaticum]
MNLAVWAERNGVAWVTAYRWLGAGALSVPARKVGRLMVVDEPSSVAGPRQRAAVSGRVSSADQKPDLDRQVVRVTGWARAELIAARLGDPMVSRIVVGRRDRFCRFGSEYVQAARACQGRELVVVDSAGVDDDLVGDKAEILASMYADLLGNRAAQAWAMRVLAAAASDGVEAV